VSAFSDALESEPSTNYSPECMVLAWCRNLAPKDATDFDTALTDPSVTTSRLWRAMRRMDGAGYKGSLSTLQRHRTGGCMCEVKR